MAFTVEQQRHIETGVVPRAHKGQTLEQSVNFSAESVLWVWQLEGLEPLPPIADVALALWEQAHAPDASWRNLTGVQRALLKASRSPTAEDDDQLWKAVREAARKIVDICERNRWLPLPPEADVAEILWTKAHGAAAGSFPTT